MIIQSPVFENHASIPDKYTCQGADVSPPLKFLDIPSGTKSLALIMDDPDAPNGTFDHWILWNLLPQTAELVEGTKIGVPQGLNHFGSVGYRGPCPPTGQTHRYFFKLYAIDVLLDLEEGATKSEVQKALEGHIISEAELVGTYQK